MTVPAPPKEEQEDGYDTAAESEGELQKRPKKAPGAGEIRQLALRQRPGIGNPLLRIDGAVL